MQKPELSRVLQIIELKEQAAKLYDEAEKLTAELMREYGAGRFDYDVTEVEGQDTPFLKVEIIDNVEALKNAGQVWKSVPFKQVSFSSSGLKRKPKSLE